MIINKLLKEETIPKIKHYCAYQERCHAEVREKLYSFKLYKKEVDEIMAQLIEENYLNEERFAMQFAGGKFRSKQWGRIKIKYMLKQKHVSEYCIKKALKQITESDYQKTLFRLAEHKINTLKSERNILNKKNKLINFLLQKGYERSLVKETVNKKMG